MALSTFGRRALSISRNPSKLFPSTVRTLPVTQCTCSVYASPSRSFFSPFSTSSSVGTSTSASSSTSSSTSTSTSNGTSSQQTTNTNGTTTQPTVESLTKTLAEKDKLITDKDKLLAESEKKIKDITDRFQRQLAETENVRQRGFTETASAKKFAITSFAKSLLEIADTLILAAQAAEPHAKGNNAELNALYEGVKMTEKILHKVFATHGVKKFESVGEKFDPHRHDGVFQVDDPSKEPGTVAHCMKDGYLIDDRVLRAAQVGTVKGRPKPAPAATPAPESTSTPENTSS